MIIPQGYEVHYHLKHDEIMPFVKAYMRKKNPVILSYWVFNFLLLAFIIFEFIYTSSAIGPDLNYFMLGFPCFMLLIPVHELLHGVGYKLAGAHQVQYKMILKKMVFYAMSDQFLTPKIAFVRLALAPFIIINSLLIVLTLILPEPYFWLCLGALFMHTAGCSGDFAMVSYFFTFWERDPITYDDVAAGESFFLLKADPATYSTTTD